MWPHANPNISPPPSLFSCESVCESSGNFCAPSPSPARPPPPIPVLLSANYRLRDSQESCLSQSEEREAQPSSPGVPLRKHLRASLVNPPPTTSALHTHTHTQMQHLVLAPHCQHHASPMFPQISINLLCLSKRS